MTDDPKTMGQIAYEAFQASFLPRGVHPHTWGDVSETTRAAWDAAAAAVHAQPHRGTVHGPCEMRDYDFITLAVPHRLEYPVDALGFPTRLPAGARLHMLEPKPGALGVSWETGSANPAGMGPHFDSPEAKARENIPHPDSPEVRAAAAGYERIDGPSFGEMVQTLRIAAKAVCDSEGNAITDEMVEVESDKLDALNKAVAAFDAAEDDGREDPRVVGYP